MANFNTHVTVAALGSGAAAITLQSLGYLEPKVMAACWISGTLGGILPDLDSDDPRALGLVFNILTAIVWVILFVTVLHKISLFEFGLLFFGSTLLVRGGLYWLFKEYTQHRGSFHSILGAIITSFVVAALLGRLIDGYNTWLIAGFCFLGFITHLLLDELYRVNLVNEEMETPLFNAFKFSAPNQLPLAATMVVIALALWFFTPGSAPIIEGYNARSELVAQRDIKIWPEDNRLFGVDIPWVTDYYEVTPTQKGIELEDNLGISDSELETKREKIDEFWFDFKEKLKSFQAQPSENNPSL